MHGFVTTPYRPFSSGVSAGPHRQQVFQVAPCLAPPADFSVGYSQLTKVLTVCSIPRFKYLIQLVHLHFKNRSTMTTIFLGCPDFRSTSISIFEPLSLNH